VRAWGAAGTVVVGEVGLGVEGGRFSPLPKRRSNWSKPWMRRI
jgi:hypothetical protein